MYLEKLFGLKGKTAVITGGGAGIGQVVARGLANAGAKVVILDLMEAKETVDIINGDGNECWSFAADVTNEEQVNRAIEDVMEKTGSLDIVFNNAGICIHKGTIEASVAEWRKVIDINLTGEYIVARSAAKIMIENNIKGSIVNMASMSGTVVNIPQWQASYNASKAGVIHLTRSLAIEWIDNGIRVNCISPGYIATPISTDTPKELKDAWIPLMPMRRMGDPEELVGAVIYLASEASTYTTGAEIIIDGGYVCI